MVGAGVEPKRAPERNQREDRLGSTPATPTCLQLPENLREEYLCTKNQLRTGAGSRLVGVFGHPPEPSANSIQTLAVW